MNLTELLDRAARDRPEKPALIEGAARVTYAQLAERVAALAAQLAAREVRAGSRMGLSYPNSVGYVALTFALWQVQAVVVPIPTECTGEEMAGIAETMQLEGMLTQKAQEGSELLATDCFFRRLTPREPASNRGVNLAFVRFTSGTTHERKGVALSHETIRDRVAAANKSFRIGPDDTVMWCLPMSHHFLITIVLYLSQGATIVLARHLLARLFLEEVNRWQGTVLYAAPFHYALLAREGSGAGLGSVRLAVSTTCPLPQNVAEDFFRRFGVPLTQALGIIELGLVALNTDDPVGRWDSVGRPAGDFRVRILEPDQNGCGEVAVCGPGFFDAYAAPWVSREQVLREGWFITGDIGRMDAGGFLFLAGRKTAVINLAGRKVFPEEIEAVLNRHPAVRESRVYGRLHPHLGEVVEADVVLAQENADQETVRAFCRANLASYKIPARLHVVHELPRTAATGKIRRAAAVV